MNGNQRSDAPEELHWSGSPSMRMALMAPVLYAAVIYGVVAFYPSIWYEIQNLAYSLSPNNESLARYAPHLLMAIIMTPGIWNFFYQTSTHYLCTTERLIIRKGILVRTEDEVELYRVIDVVASANIFQMLLGVGSVFVKSTDQTGNVLIASIPDATKVRNIIRTSAENCKTQRGTLRVLNELGPAL